MAGQFLADEIEQLSRPLAEHGPTRREDLERSVRGRLWGPGLFRKALREAVPESRVKSRPDDTCALSGRSTEPGEKRGTSADN
jgi:hypothetical protein